MLDSSGKWRVLQPPVVKPTSPTRMSILQLKDGSVMAVNPIDMSVKVLQPPIERPETQTMTETYDVVPAQPEIVRKFFPNSPATPEGRENVKRRVITKVPINAATPSPIAGTKKTLTKAKAEEFKNLAGGNRAKAEALARAAGYDF